MWLTPAIFLFSLGILISVLLVISAPSLFISWLGLELNTLTFIPLLLLAKDKLSSEAAIKYFLTQTLASILFIFSSILVVFLDSTLIFNIMITIALAIKLGAAPFHSWLMTVGESCTWMILLILLTIQKINPLLILWGSMSTNSNLYLFIILSSVLVGGFLGLAQTNCRLMLIFSSINHVGWLMAGLSFNLWLGVIYFLIYLLVLYPIMNVFGNLNISHLNQLASLNLTLGVQLSLFVSFLSLGGLPPFLGFLPKWIILQSILQSGLVLLGGVLILMSLFTLYYYLRLSFSALILSSKKVSVISNSTLENNFTLFLISTSFLGLPLIFLL